MCMKDRLILQREADLEMTCVKCNKNRSSDFAHAVSSVASTNSDRSYDFVVRKSGFYIKVLESMITDFSTVPLNA